MCFVPLPYSDEELTAAAETLVAENTKGLPATDDLALITFATPGPLGYMVGTNNGPPTVMMHTFPIPKDRYRRFFTEGVVLAMAGLLPDFDEIPAGVKHRSRIHWWAANQTTRGPGLVPVLVAEKDVPDTAVGAVLTVKEGVIEYPAAGSVLDSISLRVVLELAPRIGVEVRERSSWAFGRAEDGVSELLLAGSAFGTAGVRRYLMLKDVQDYPWPGPVFTKLAAAWSEMVTATAGG
ncbi:MAG: aminotransferase class IV [Fimbriiglobus sp.]|nr:aminotransferase class IV [Fimbriiglobus sp.]